MPSSNVCWGVDIGAGAIKAVKLEREGDEVKLTDFAVVPHKKVLSTPELDPDEAVRVALGALMAQYRDEMRGAMVVCSVPGHQAFVRFAKLPPVEPKQVPSVVKFEAVQQIPFAIEEVEWDYQVFASDDSPDVEVGIFAMTRERVNEKLALWGDAGLEPHQITVGSIAAYNAIAFDYGFDESTPGTVILDIGTTATDLIIAEGGRVWIRTFPLGGHHFTEALGETFNLSYGKAEKLKRESETSKYKRHVFEAVKPVLSDLAQDVQRSIGYYLDSHRGAELKTMVGLGSTFKLLGLRKMLSQQLKLEVFALDAYRRIKIDGQGKEEFESAAGSMATAYGLALQGLDLVPISCNLMPTSVVRQAMWRRKTPWFIGAAVIAVMGGLVTFLRPFQDDQGLVETAKVQSVSDTIRRGDKAKSEWEQAKRETEPEFAAVNVLRLLDGRDVYGYVAHDVDQMLNSATSAAPDSAPRFGVNGQTYDLRALATDFVKPGASIGYGASESPSPAPRSRGRGGGNDDAGADAGGQAEGPDATQAGPYGAIRVTIRLDHHSRELVGDRADFNDHVLGWLRDNYERDGVPYTIVQVPDISLVGRAPAPEDATENEPIPRPSGGRGAPSGGPRGGGGNSGVGGTTSGMGGASGMGGTTSGGSGAAPPPSGGGKPSRGVGGRPRGGDGSGQPDRGGAPRPRPEAPPEAGSLAEIAPLPPRPVRTKADAEVYRYEFTFWLNLKEPSSVLLDDQGAEAQSADAGAPAGDREDG